MLAKIRKGLRPLIFSAEKAFVKRRICHDGDALGPAERKQGLFRVGLDKAVGGLEDGEVAGGGRGAEFFDVEIAHAIMPDFSLAPEVLHRLGDNVKGRQLVIEMEKIEVNRIDFETAQRSFASFFDMGGGEVGIPRSVGAEMIEDFRGDDELVSGKVLNNFPEYGLGQAVPVGIGCVEKIDPEVKGGSHGVGNFGFRKIAPKPGAQLPSAETEAGNPETRFSEKDRMAFHGFCEGFYRVPAEVRPGL